MRTERQRFALMPGMHPVTIDLWPYIGLNAKSDEMETGAILRQKKVIRQARAVEAVGQGVGTKRG